MSFADYCRQADLALPRARSLLLPWLSREVIIGA
jgi:hypothetical protein